MPAEPFSVHVDPDDLLRQNLASAVGGTSRTTPETDRAESTATERHGTRDARLAARQRSERDRSGRAAGTGGGRSYAFRRS
jgi:hypothetical protein